MEDVANPWQYCACPTTYTRISSSFEDLYQYTLSSVKAAWLGES
jgi:hypothetical protein